MKMKTCKSIIYLVTALIISACANDPAAIPEDAGETIIPTGAVTLTKVQIENAGIEYGKIESRELPKVVNARGKLVLPVGSSASVGSFANGIVTEIMISQSEHVKAGQNLCSISHSGIIDLQQDYLEALYDMNTKEQQYKRSKQLYEEDATSQKSYQKANSEYLKSKSAFESYKAQLNLLNISPDMIESGEIQSVVYLKSPIDGIVDAINIHMGSYITEDDILFEIIDRSRLNIELLVLEKDISLIRKGQPVYFSLANLSDVEYKGTIKLIAGTLDEKSKVLRVIAEFENTSDHLYPGMFIASGIQVDLTTADVLPADAIISESEDEHYLFYTTQPDPEKENTVTFEKLDVELGIQSEQYVEIRNLSQDQKEVKYVVKGAYYLKSELLKQLE